MNINVIGLRVYAALNLADGAKSSVLVLMSLSINWRLSGSGPSQAVYKLSPIQTADLQLYVEHYIVCRISSLFRHMIKQTRQTLTFTNTAVRL